MPVNEGWWLVTTHDHYDFMEKYSDRLKEANGFIGIHIPKEEGVFEKSIYGKSVQLAMIFDTSFNAEIFGDYLTNHGIDENELGMGSNAVKFKQPMLTVKESPYFYVDKVKISTEELKKINHNINMAVDNHKISLAFDVITEENVVLTRYALELGKGKYALFTWSAKENRLYVECYSGYSNLVFKGYDDVYGETILTYFNKDNESEETKIGLLKSAVMQFWCVNYFMKTIPSSYTTTKTKTEKVVCEGKGTNKRYKTKVVIRTDYEINVKHITNQYIQHTITCLCWGVRGHFRHYKNGKTTFISAYQKGKNRHSQAPRFKDYEIKVEEHEEKD